MAQPQAWAFPDAFSNRRWIRFWNNGSGTFYEAYRSAGDVPN